MTSLLRQGVTITGEVEKNYRALDYYSSESVEGLGKWIESFGTLGARADDVAVLGTGGGADDEKGRDAPAHLQRLASSDQGGPLCGNSQHDECWP